MKPENEDSKVEGRGEGWREVGSDAIVKHLD